MGRAPPVPLSEAAERLESALSGSVLRDEPMARHTSYRVGGPAALFVTCDTLGDVSTCATVLAEEGVEWTVLGKGTNVLVSDEGYPGAIVVLGREFRSSRFEGERLEAGAGCLLARLVQDAYAKGLAGLECAVGIPGTLGGALVMNAGSRDDWIGESVESVTVVSPDKGLLRLRGSDIDWRYRRTDLPDHGVVVEAQLRVFPDDVVDLKRRMESAFRRRKATQPMGKPSAGSVFVNPADDSAGRLIESVGLKGRRLGGAAVSDVHANFIVNQGGATARDILLLMHLIRDTVRDTHGVELTAEVRFLGSFS